MELFPTPNYPSQLEIAPSLSQKMPLLSYGSFLLFLGHKETFAFLQKLSCFSLFVLFTTFRQLPFILLFSFVMDFLIFTKAS